MKIRSIDLADKRLLEECANMMSTSEPWITLGRSHQECISIFKNPALDTYVAYQENKVIGFAILSMSGQFTGYIKSLLIHPAFQNQGFGKSFLSYLETLIFKKHPNVFLCVSSFNPRAKAFYHKQGYDEIGEINNLVMEGHSEFLMRKTIGPINRFKQNVK